MTIGWVEVLASAALVVVAVGLSLWRGLGVERSIVWASLRGAVQLIAVGLLFELIFETAGSMLWAWLWVVGMLLVSAETVGRRARKIPNVRLGALLSLTGALGVTLAIIFGLGVFELAPVTLVVTAGITLGNTLPAAVLGVDTAARDFSDTPERAEGLLALGMTSSAAGRFVTQDAVRRALIPQIERTKVVGLIALPGAMTGMLLAGSDAISAVLVQIVIMYLVLGSVAVAVVVVVTVIAIQAFTQDSRLREWVTQRT